MSSRKPSEQQSSAERQDEQSEIADFNQNTDYDVRNSLHNSDDGLKEEIENDELAMGQFILSARIYDVLMALLQIQNPEYARDLLEMHASGTVVGPTPAFNGVFLTNIMNEEESDDDS